MDMVSGLDWPTRRRCPSVRQAECCTSPSRPGAGGIPIARRYGGGTPSSNSKTSRSRSTIACTSAEHF